LPDRVDARLAAQTATAGNCSETLRCVQLRFHTGRKLNNDDVIAFGRDPRDLVALANNPFANEKSSCEFFIVTGRPHRSGDGLASDADFQRLFDRQLVGQVLELTVAFTPDDLM
jgi:hypothetical protein